MYSVIVIEDSLTMRNLIKGIIDELDGFYVVNTAKDAYDAREKIKQYEPDLVTIDINMPKMNGISFLKNLMRLHPMPAVVVSSVDVNQQDIIDGGAIGFIQKQQPTETLEEFKTRLQKGIKNTESIVANYTLKKPKPTKAKVQVDTPVLIEKRVHPDEVLLSTPAIQGVGKIIGIGSSTGGVESLIKVFSSLPDDLPPIVITQHIPYGFSGSFAQRLNSLSKVDVSEVETQTILEYGHAYLAPGNQHLVIKKQGNNYIATLLDAQKVSRHKPSVDIMFRSLNNSAGSDAMAVIMTGMGDDGTIGIKELYNNGAYTVAQNEESCVVFGMPQQAIKANAINDICHLDDIAQCIIDFAQNKRGKNEKRF
jgi:two-component system chemotaxis response regulator CheB